MTALRRLPWEIIRPWIGLAPTTTPFYPEATPDLPGLQTPKYPKRLGLSIEKNPNFIRERPQTSPPITRGPVAAAPNFYIMDGEAMSLSV